MRRAHWLVATLMVALTGGSRTVAETLHGVAHQLLAHHEETHHHDADHVVVDAVDHQHATVDHAEPRHGHDDADQIGAGGHQTPPTAEVAADIPAWPTAERWIRIGPTIETVPKPRLPHAAGPPTRAPPSKTLPSA